MSNQSSGDEPGEKMEENDLVPGYKNIEDFTKEGFKVLMESIRNSNALPNGRDWSYFNTFDSFKEIMNHEGVRLQRMMNNILHIQDIGGNIRHKLLDEKIELVVEANDVILEKVANNIDEMNGIKKNVIAPVEIQTVSAHLPINASWNRVTSATFSVSGNLGAEKNSPSRNSIRLLTAKNIVRPQKLFKDKIDNSNRPWEPRITDKPNSLKPLAIFLEETENGEQFSHAYQLELEHFTTPPSQLQDEEAVPPKPISETPLIEITEPDHLNNLVETLRNCKSFSVDLEHHSYRSFMGMTCLMQISTQDSDYLIDTLSLRDKLSVLNEVFTKPTILKIFHGADMDIQWLQRDLSIYVVNMFDTHQAAKMLEYPALSLSYLMKKFCNFIPNKQFQLADWRIRPLPEELKSYAREDTHYLLYIYQMMKKELLQKGNGSDNFLRSVYQKSTQVCLKRYLKPILRDDSHMDLYRKSKRLFHNRQLYALKGLYKWRDEISRREDESTGYVLPNHMLLQISESLPREMQGILACCNPTPPLVKANLLELHHIILKARDQPLEKAILKEDNRSRGSTVQFVKIDMDSPLHCPHDLSNARDFRDDLPTLMNGKISNEIMSSEKREMVESRYSIFNVSRSVPEADVTDTSNILQVKFLTPYQRYKLARTFIRAEEELAAAGMASEAAKSTETVSEGDNNKVTSDNNAILHSHANIDTTKTIDRTDEERIASIRNHYLTLARQTAESQSREVVLTFDDDTSGKPLQVEDRKKRKRDSSCNDSNIEAVVDATIDENQLQTPRPSVFTRIAPKRTSSEAFGEEADFSGKRSNFGNKRKNKNKKRKQQNRDKVTQNNQHEQSSSSINSANQDQISEDAQEFDFRQQFNSNRGHGNKHKNKQKFHKNKKNFHKDNKTDQSTSGCSHSSNDTTFNVHKKRGGGQSNFKPFDYSSVDYRDFQGGAGSAQKNQQFKGTFKGRGKGRSGKRGNKSSFENNRGRGRRGR